jgi:uncharacterized protein
MKALRCWMMCLLLLAGGGCDLADRQPPNGEEAAGALPSVSPAAFRFDSALVRVETAADTHLVRVEVAERPDQRGYGLMDRTSLDQDAGMVFLYDTPQDPSSGFWMYRTRIPLDIAFFDGSGVIVAVLPMEPCASPDPEQCRVAARGYAPGKPYVGALEVNRGYFTRNRVQIGDRITVVRR